MSLLATERIFRYHNLFQLESGGTLPGFHLAYTTHGALNAAGDNVVWVFHALTANSNPVEWWPGLCGKGCVIDPEKYFIVCVNMPGSCYGSISPLDENAETGLPYHHQFPAFTTRDMIRTYQHLRHALHIRKIFLGLGGSMGGQQLLEWAIEEPDLFEHILPVATNAVHSAWGIAFNATQRFCIEQDPTWKEDIPHAGHEGMKTARAVALLSYRNYTAYQKTQTGTLQASNGTFFKAESYQKYQGEKLARRFNAYSYYFLSKSMDSHHVGRGRPSVEAALNRITARTLVVGIDSDVLFPLVEQEFIAAHIPNARFVTISSDYGHDGFLLEFEKLSALIEELLMKVPAKAYQQEKSC